MEDYVVITVIDSPASIPLQIIGLGKLWKLYPLTTDQYRQVIQSWTIGISSSLKREVQGSEGPSFYC